jgi:NDP-hexose-3-ketoreductase
MSSSRLRLGIIACSSVARRRFLPALKTSNTACLQHIGSRDRGRAEQFALDQNCPRFGTYEDVLCDPDVDAVYISTPVALHEEWVRRAALYGKHILCEKPVCTSHAAALALTKHCRAKGVRLMEGYAFRFHPQHALARQIIAQNQIGQPRYFSGEFTYPQPPAGDFRLNPELGGGVFHDALGYPVAAAMMMIASAPVVVSCEWEMDPQIRVERRAVLRLSFAGGEVAHCLAGFGLHYRSSYAVLGTAGRLELERAYSVSADKATGLLVERETGGERVEVPAADQFQLMIDEFAGQIAGNRPQTNWEGEVLQQHLVMDCALQSAGESRTVKVPRVNADSRIGQ